MAKFGIGESVRFKASELLVSTGCSSVKIGTDGLVGRVTGSVQTTGEETKYYVEVKLPDGTFTGVSDVTLKLTALESQIQSEKEHLDAKFDEFVKRVIPTFNPEPYSWVRDFFGDSACAEKKSVDVPNCFADLKKLWEERLGRYDVSVKKMSKSRCVKLLESYRAEREKVKKGRKFERCLRDSVVDEALERAIELLKGGTE